MDIVVEIIVEKYHDEYYVWKDPGGKRDKYGIPLCNDKECKKFTTRSEALVHAHDLNSEYHAEYGVQEYDYDARYEASLWKIPVPYALEPNDVLVVDPKDKSIARVERHDEVIYNTEESLT